MNELAKEKKKLCNAARDKTNYPNISFFLENMETPRIHTSAKPRPMYELPISEGGSAEGERAGR